MTQTGGSTESQDWAYGVRLNGELLVTVRSRHAAVGLTCVFRRHNDSDATVSIDPMPHTNTNELRGLKDEPAKADY